MILQLAGLLCDPLLYTFVFGLLPSGSGFLKFLLPPGDFSVIAGIDLIPP